MALPEFLFTFIWVAVLLYFLWYLFMTDCDTILAIAEKFGKPVSDFAGKVIWVTGASTGLGEAMAYELASVGAKLILTARSKDLLQKVKEECIERSNGKLSKEDILVLPFDISNLECHKDHVENAINHFKKIDVLINNAARYQVGEIVKTDTEVDKTLFNVNYFGPLNLSKLLCKHFLQKGRGHIVVITSIAGKVGIPSTASYCGTKHALHGYFEALRMEYNRDNITVTTVCPGIFSSSIFEKTITTSTDKILQKDYDHYECVNMTSERCAHLALVASVNKLYESWVAYQPFLFMLWGAQYLSDVYKIVVGFLYSKKRINQLYEGKWPRDLLVWRPLLQNKVKTV
ncbi:dehydrogenase/reductase SDR family member 7-like [Argiope bruennichi]|uniref:Dehydrogenase/reductase SDR family member 7 like protein n=1 Tax=Argiope bruennichi TaxID=94029 RepID=A0A8T0EYL0_ARGBR|nr:dehydrogenase/reductase SDR family member 7-like [Argiope bruennichi]XP_055934868.1 dehydrogenase/reductase SDR family member 7-like [Argiope bruennichi]XP_055934869.1 dehydrogenase/reductase SDR family member 7-like [Argiope bruennichi]KAF8781412.1 Dehydrogenase/reductase SDR family member 7 like protein [Argiope bruennichi]